MPRSFDLPRLNGVSLLDPRVAMRVILGALALANLVAALLVFKPWGGSPADLEAHRAQLERQAADMRQRLERTRQVAQKVHQARSEGDRFLADYMMDRQSTFSTIVSELDRVAKEAGITTKERSWTLEEVEGSDTVMQMTITSGFEGAYANLTKFVNLLDKSPRFLVIETLQAAPQQGSNLLNISIKLDTFVRQSAGAAS